jgi:hypothetical protein
MTDRKQIESILRVNGLHALSQDEEIRSVLLSARFADDEVKAALVILRENTKTNETTVDGLHKVFRSDEALKPKEISRLLGITIAVSDHINHSTKKRSLSWGEFFLLTVGSFLLTGFFMLFYMYSHDMGVFHQASEPMPSITPW